MSESENPVVKWAELLEGQLRLGKTKSEATNILVRRYPGLHRAMLEAANAGRPKALRAIAARFERGQQ